MIGASTMSIFKRHERNEEDNNKAAAPSSSESAAATILSNCNTNKHNNANKQTLALQKAASCNNVKNSTTTLLHPESNPINTIYYFHHHHHHHQSSVVGLLVAVSTTVLLFGVVSGQQQQQQPPMTVFNRTLGPARVFTGLSVMASSTLASPFGCREPQRALGEPDWSSRTSCAITTDVSDCHTPYARCGLAYMCQGWAGNPASHEPQYLRLRISDSEFGVTNITMLEIHDKASRGQIHRVFSVDAAGFKRLLWAAVDGVTPPATYKESPEFRAGGSYYAPGIDYRGGVNLTRSGAICDGWNKTSFAGYTQAGIADHNYCRNPDNNPSGPWCYVKNGGGRNESCAVPAAPDGCDDKPTYIPFSRPIASSAAGIEIEMKPLHGAIAAIDAIKVYAQDALACFDDDTRGHYQPPNCDKCRIPFKGPRCNSQLCPSGSACAYGNCSDMSWDPPCRCFPGFFGPTCEKTCPVGNPAIEAEIHKFPLNSSLKLFCSGHGMCHDTHTGNGTCTCAHGYAGPACNITCPGLQTNGSVCSDAGVCHMGSGGNGTCSCVEGRYDTDCSRRLCGNTECFHGTCRNGRCFCDGSTSAGYWSGSKCNKCSSLYTGDMCTRRKKTRKTLLGSFCAGAVPTYNPIHALPTTAATFYLSGTGKYVVEIGRPASTPTGCAITISNDQPTGKCTAKLTTENSHLIPIKFHEPDTSLCHTYNITFDYEPACSYTCHHGYCYAPDTEVATVGGGFIGGGGGGGGGVTASVLGLHFDSTTDGAQEPDVVPRGHLGRALLVLQTGPFTVSLSNFGLHTSESGGCYATLKWDQSSGFPTEAKGGTMYWAVYQPPLPSMVTADDVLVEATSGHIARGSLAVANGQGGRLTVASGLTSDTSYTLIFAIRFDTGQVSTLGQASFTSPSPNGYVRVIDGTVMGSPPTAGFKVVAVADSKCTTYFDIVAHSAITSVSTPFQSVYVDSFNILAKFVSLEAVAGSSSIGGGTTNVVVTPVSGYSKPPLKVSYQMYTGASNSARSVVQTTHEFTFDSSFSMSHPLTSPVVPATGIAATGGQPLSWGGVTDFATDDTILWVVYARSDVLASNIDLTSVQPPVMGAPQAQGQVVLTSPDSAMLSPPINTLTSGTEYKLFYSVRTAGTPKKALLNGPFRFTTSANAWSTVTTITLDSATPTSLRLELSIYGRMNQQMCLVLLVSGAPRPNSIENFKLSSGMTYTGVAKHQCLDIVMNGPATLIFDASGLSAYTTYYLYYTFVQNVYSSNVFNSGTNGPKAYNTTEAAIYLSSISQTATGESVSFTYSPTTSQIGTLTIVAALSGHGTFTMHDFNSPVGTYGVVKRVVCPIYYAVAGHTCMIDGLLSDTAYEFTVMTRTPSGVVASDWSSYYKVSTSKIVPVLSSFNFTKIASTSVYATFTPNGFGTIRFIVHAYGAYIDYMNFSTAAVGSLLTVNATLFRGVVNDIRIEGLSPGTQYDMLYVAESTSDPAPHLIGAIQGSFPVTTIATITDTSSLKYMIRPAYLNELAVSFTCTGIAGTIWFVVLPRDYTPKPSNYTDVTSSPGPVATKSVAIAPGTHYSLVVGVLAYGTTYDVYYITQSTSAGQYSAVSPRTSISTGGVVPTTTTTLVAGYSTYAVYKTTSDLFGRIIGVLLYADEVAPTSTRAVLTNTVPNTLRNMSVALNPTQPTQYSIPGLFAGVSYVFYYVVSDEARATVGPIETLSVQSGDADTTGCSIWFDAASSQDVVCTAYSATKNGQCECFAGYRCNITASKCVNEESYLRALAGTGYCQCDNSTSNGYWNGTRCNSCQENAFGENCEFKCVRGYLPYGSTKCECPSNTKFSGRICDQCPQENGYFGDLCSTAGRQSTMQYTVSLGPSTYVYMGMYRALSYSSVRLTLSSGNKDNLRLMLLSAHSGSYSDLAASVASSNEGMPGQRTATRVPTAGPGATDTTSASAGDFSNLLTNSTNYYTYPTKCLSAETWEQDPPTCEVAVPIGGAFFSLYIENGDIDATYKFTLSAISPCCNQHGFCKNYTDVCECASDTSLGYWDSSSQCSTCLPGYGGSLCTDFSGTYRSTYTPSMSTSAGDTHWYALDVARGMPFTAKLSGAADCDLAVRMTTVCGGDGWTNLDGFCYRLYGLASTECLNYDNAKSSCTNAGGSLTSPVTTREWDLVKYLWGSSGISKDRMKTTVCSQYAAVGIRRLPIQCKDYPFPNFEFQYHGTPMPRQQKQCVTSPFNKFCHWDGSACLVTEKYNCHAQLSKQHCHYYNEAGTRKDRMCVWEEWGGVAGSYCAPGYYYEDGRASDLAATELMRSAFSELQLGPCTSKMNQRDCDGLPHLCMWKNMMCIVNPVISPEAQGTDSNLWYRYIAVSLSCIRVAVVSEDQNNFDRPALILYPSQCDTKQTTTDATNPHAAMSGYLCRRNLQVETSAIDRQGGMAQAPTLDKSLFGTATCDQYSTETNDTCTIQADTAVDMAIVRVTCLNDKSSYRLDVQSVPTQRFYTQSYGPCYNDDTFGHWAGVMCTDCMPGYSGPRCTERERCGLTECGSHGACVTGYAGTQFSNTTLGQCTCSGNYYGLKCDTYCDATTCNWKGSCNRHFQRCNATWGVPSTCTIGGLCNCHGNHDGNRCETCKYGFWGANCTRACACNGQPCNAKTGRCQCYANTLRGYWNITSGCTSCAVSYYGLECNVYCHRTKTCSGHGACTRSGKCSCETNWYSPTCSKQCNATYCSNHGTCSETGTCECTANYQQGFWGGATCSICANGYWGLTCTNNCRCSMNGVCAQLTGACNCYDNDVNGHWVGETCSACAEGWTGTLCDESTTVFRNEFGRELVLYSTMKVTKPWNRGGALVVHNSSDGLFEHMFAASGTEVSFFKRELAKATVRSWEYVASCNFRTLLGFGSVIVNGPKYGNMAYFGLQDATTSYVLPWDMASPPFSSLKTCTYNTSHALSIHDPTTSLSNVSYKHELYGIDVDPVNASVYVLYHRYDYSDVTATNQYMMTRIDVYNKAAGATLTLGTTTTLFQLRNVSTMVVVRESATAQPYFMVAGKDGAGQVILSKIYPASATVNAIRTLFSFMPAYCTRVVCSEVLKLHYFEHSLFGVVQIVGSTYAVTRMNITGTMLKSSSNSQYMSMPSTTFTGLECGFLVGDPFTKTLYFGVGNSTPGRIFHIDVDLKLLPDVQVLDYEHTAAEYQMPVAAVLDEKTRLLYIVNKLTSTQVMGFNTWHVRSVSPVVVDGGGGTTVTVVGSGFRLLESDPSNAIVVCNFGGYYNRLHNATLINSTHLLCTAPLITGFDPCKDVALEVGFACAKCSDIQPRFSSNDVRVRHISMCTLDSILPSNRGFLNFSTTQLTVTGSGFIETPYLKCLIDGVETPAKFDSSKELLCYQPDRPAAKKTTLQVTLDGQIYSQGLVYYIVGLPNVMQVTWSKSSDNSALDVVAVTVGGRDYAAVLKRYASPNMPLENIVVTFMDSAGNAVKDRQEALINYTVSVSLASGPTSIRTSEPLAGRLLHTAANYVTTAQRIDSETEGVVTFKDLHLIHPARGVYAIDVNCTYNNMTQRLYFFVEIVTTQAVFQTTPDEFTTYKAILATQPVLAYVDDTGNVAVTDVSDMVVTAEPVSGGEPATLTGHTSTDFTVVSGIVTFSKIKLVGTAGETYRLTFQHKSITGAAAKVNIRMAVCATSNELISSISPRVGRLNARVVTVSGWGFSRQAESYTKCRFGSDDPVQATVIDTCNIACILPQRAVPMSSPVEVSVNMVPRFTTAGINYSFVDVADQLRSQTNVLTYPSDSTVNLADMLVTVHDAFGSQLINNYDTENRTVYVRSSLTLVKSSNPGSVTLYGGAATVKGLQTTLPKSGSYVMYFTTKNEEMPDSVLTSGSAGGSGGTDNAVEKTRVVDPSATQTQSPTATSSIELDCPKPKACIYENRNYMTCIYEESFMYTMTPTLAVGGGSSSDGGAVTPAPSGTPPPNNGTVSEFPDVTSPARPTASGFYFRSTLLIRITPGQPKRMEVKNTFSLFTTSKRKLDIQPIIRITDLAGNTVLSYEVTPAVTATISPIPLCHGTKTSSQTQAQFEASCERLKGAQEFVVGGLASFTGLFFRGTPGTKYVLTFSVTLPGIDPIKSQELYAADCPTANDPIDSISPDWVSTTGGVTVTVRGWDFQPAQQLYLNFAGTQLPLVYVDTCKCTVDIPKASALHHTHPVFRTLQATTPQGLSLTVVDRSNPSYTAKSLSFQIKATTAVGVAFGTGAEAAGYGVGNQTIASNRTTCLTVTERTHCFTSERRVYLAPIYVVQVDLGGGELYGGVGWTSSNADVTVGIVVQSKPADENRTLASDIIKGAELTGPTLLGIRVLTNLYIDNPRSGDYVFTFSTNAKTSTGAAFTAGTFSLRFGPGAPVKLALHSLDAAVYDPKEGLYVYYRKPNAELKMSLQLSDVVGNVVGITTLQGQSSLEAAVSVRPSSLVQPYPYRDIGIPTTADEASYGEPASLQPSRAKLNADFSFLTTKAVGIWFGVRYNVTFELMDGYWRSRLPAISILLEVANCDSFLTTYGQNMTSTCLPLPDGATMSESNSSVFMSALPNYWRNHWQDVEFFPCEATNCLGGFWSECTRGTEGPTCAVCEDNWGKQGDVCLECPEMYVNVLALLGMALATLFVVIIMVKSNLSTEAKAKSLFSIVIKVLMNHLQTATLMQDFQTKIKGIVKDLMGAQEKTAPDTNVSNFACATGWDQYNIFLMWMISPTLIIVVPGILSIVLALKSRHAVGKRMRELKQEIDTRHRMGLEAEDQEVHLQALKTGMVPTLTLDDHDSDDEDHKDRHARYHQPVRVSPDEAPGGGATTGDEGSADSGDVAEYDMDEVEQLMSEQNLTFQEALERERDHMRQKRLERAAAEETKIADDEATRVHPTQTRVESAVNIILSGNPAARDIAHAVVMSIHEHVTARTEFATPEEVGNSQPRSWTAIVSAHTHLALWEHVETKKVTFACPPGMSVPDNAIGGAQDPTANDPATRRKAGEKVMRNRLMLRMQAEAAERHPNKDEAAAKKVKKESECLKNCAVCGHDFAVCLCEECNGDGVWDGGKPFCERCFDVMHAAPMYADHVPRPTAVAKDTIPDYGRHRDQLRNEIIAMRKTMDPREVYVVTVLVVVFMVYPRLMTQVATMMKCTAISTLGRSYLAVDMRIECDTAEYNRWRQLAVIFFFAYGLGIPILGSYVLWRNRKRLLTRSCLATYGFLYSGFRLNRYYWEFIIMVRKMFVVFIIVFYEGNRGVQSALGQWLITGFLLINIFARPFQYRLLWQLENCSLASVVITLNAAMLYQPMYDLSSSTENAVTIVIFIVNVLVLVLFGYYLYYAARQQFLETFDEDRSGNVSWDEVRAVLKRRAFESFGRQLEDMGFDKELELDEIQNKGEAIVVSDSVETDAAALALARQRAAAAGIEMTEEEKAARRRQLFGADVEEEESYD
eukprot:PhM_4_TR523/c0_g1_i1/m.38965